DLAALPTSGLAERLGPEGPRLVRLCRGEDDLPLVPTAAPESFTLTLDLDWPVDGLEPLAFLLAPVLQPLRPNLAAPRPPPPRRAPSSPPRPSRHAAGRPPPSPSISGP